MQSFGLRFLALCCLLFTTFADQPLVLRWSFEQSLPILAPGAGGNFNNLHVHDPQSLTFIYQSGAEAVVVDRLTSTGSHVWHREFQFLTNSGFRLRKTAVTRSGNIILAGHREWKGVGETFEDAHIIQRDSSGNELWRHRFVDAQDPRDFVHDLLIDDQSNVYVGASKNWEFFVAKLSPAGSLLWQTNLPSINGNSVGGAYSLALHPNGSLYAADRNRLLRLTTDGEILWEKPTAAIQDTIRIGPSGSLFLGMRQPFFNNDPQPLAKFDESGNHLWTSNGGDDFAILPDERFVRPTSGVIVEKADGSGVDDMVYGPLDSVSQILQLADQRIFVSSWRGFLELRPDLSRFAFYPETNNLYLPESSLVMASDGTNVYRAGIYRQTNGVLWAELRAWAPTNSAALPRILEHPPGASILAGEDFTTSVRVADTPPGFELSHQWYEWNGQSFYAIEGATNTTLQLTNLPPSYTGPTPFPRSFSIRISNSLATIYSREADLWVHVRPNLTNAPIPNPSLSYAGERVEWRITSSATAPLVLQWFKDSNPIHGATNYTYSITNLGPEHLGLYSVFISNAVGQSTSPAAPFLNLLTNVSIESLPFLPGPVIQLPLMRSDGSGNIIAVHSRSAEVGSEIIVSKFASDGTLLWRTNANFVGNSVTSGPSDVIQSLALSAAGELFLAGSAPGSSPSSSRKPAILRLSANGDLLDQLSVTGRVTRISNLLLGSSGDIFVGGVLQEGTAYYVLLCLSETGSEKWSVRFPSPVPYSSMHWITPMQLDLGGNVVFTGPSSRAVYSFSPTGSTNWSTSLLSFTPSDLERAPSEIFYLSGIYSNRPALVSITALGSRSPIRYLPHLNAAVHTDLQIDPEGALYFLCAANPSVGPRPSLSRLNTNGTPVWSASFSSEIQPAFTIASPNAIYVAGSHSRFSESGLMKFDRHGVRRWTRPESFGQLPILASATESILFTTAYPSSGLLLRVEDHEHPDVQNQSARIFQHIADWPILEANAVNAPLLRQRWILPGAALPSSTAVFPFLEIPFPQNAFTKWSVELTTPDAVLVTPDYFPSDFALILTPARNALENFSIRAHGPPSTAYYLEASNDLRTWFRLNPGAFDQSGNATLIESVPLQESNRFYRISRFFQ